MSAMFRCRIVRALPLLVLSIAWPVRPDAAPASAAGGGPGVATAATDAGEGRHAGGASGVAYTLAATWSEAPPRPGPGRFADAGDIAATPDGTLLVLDRHHNAVHVLGADGGPRALWPNPATTVDGGNWQWVRLDTGVDGAAHVLARGVFAKVDGPPETRWRVDVLDGAGARTRGLDLGSVAPERYVDLAVHPDGRIYVTRTNGNVVRSGTYAIDVFSPGGERLRSLVPPQLTIPINLDVAGDGTLYVVDQWPHTGAPGPGSGKVDGVAIFGPDEAYRETVQFSGAMDVAVGPAGVFVSRDNGVYALRSRQPLYAGPTVQKSPYRLPALGTPTMFSLAVPAAGPSPLVASMSHCTYQGVVAFARPEAGAAPVYHGALDLPVLRGPVYPLRAAFGARLELLQGRFEPLPPGEGSAAFASQLYTTAPQTVQHWGSDGALLGQLGLCGMWNAPQAYADVAADGEDVYSIDHQLITHRPDDHPPAWEKYALELSLDVTVTPHLSAVAADGGGAAVLDVGSSSVLIVDDAGKRVASWPYAATSPDPWAPTDIAMAGDRVVLASGNDGELRMFGRDGAPVARWKAPRPIRGVAIAPGGDVVALDRFGWAYHVAVEAAAGPDGGGPLHRARLVTAWPMPDRAAVARDIAVDPSGRVYVPWVDLAPTPDAVDVAQRVLIRRAGVWVFQPSRASTPVETPVLATSGRADCLVRADSVAAPRILGLGASATVEHRVDGACAGAATLPVRVAIVFNASESMNTDNGLERAKVGVIDLVSRLDPARTELALIAFADGAAVQAACPSGPADVRPAVANLVAAGDTDWTGALALAGAALACPGGRPDVARRVVLMVTDGARPGAGDDPSAALAALRAQGVEVYSQLHPFLQIAADDVQAAVALAGGTDRAFTAHTPEGLDRQADRVAGRATVIDVPFAALEVGVDLAPDVDFVPGSAEPPATFDPAARTLRWGRMTMEGPNPSVVVRYRVTPRRAGSWVAVLAGGAAALQGGTTAGGRLGFPLPALHVRGASEVLLPRVERP